MWQILKVVIESILKKDKNNYKSIDEKGNNKNEKI